MIGRRYYKILDVSEDASEDEIKTAYRRAASKYHPDKNAGREAEAAKEFQEVKEAYECLIDPERRAIYDEGGDATVQTGNPVEDLFIYMINELYQEGVMTVAELLAKARYACDQLLGETDELSRQKVSEVLTTTRMLTAIKYTGKGHNLLEGLLKSKLEEAKKSVQDLAETKNTAQGVSEMVKEYQGMDRGVDRPNGASSDVRIRFDDLTKRGRPGKRSGSNFPFV